MSPAKLAVQVAHASVGAYRIVVRGHDDVYLKSEEWFSEGFRKVVLKAKSRQEILDLEQRCAENGVVCFVVYDFGLTELEENTLTCIGIGPDTNKNVDKITGRLGLYKT
jgi:PTH2 family peptidyl-tRNA hydrolase